MASTDKTVRTYMNFSPEIDPAKILTMADLELSISLASTLVAFNDEREPVSALAEKWVPVPPNKMVFTLKPNLKWSDGSAITARQFKDCLDRAAKTYPDDLKALFDAVSSIEANDDRTLTFTTKSDVLKSGIVLKLTEPMYGLLHLKNGKLDLSVSSGAYVLKSANETEAQLGANSHWYQYVSEMPKIVEIRRVPKGVDLGGRRIMKNWVNLITGSSLMRASTSESLKKNHFRTWQRTLDKVYSLYPSKNFIQRGGAEFIRHLAIKLDKSKVLTGFAGFTPADQFFPRGYELWSMTAPKFEKAAKPSSINSVHVIIVDSPIAGTVKENISALIHRETGAKVETEIITVLKIEERTKKGDYDLFASQIAVADPNFEGAMSFFIEREPAAIPSGPAPFDFSRQTKEARSLPTSKERAQRMREIIIKAQESGYVLPLFHFSSMAIAKHGIDLSSIPNSDETVLFSKVRME